MLDTISTFIKYNIFTFSNYLGNNTLGDSNLVVEITYRHQPAKLDPIRFLGLGGLGWVTIFLFFFIFYSGLDWIWVIKLQTR